MVATLITYMKIWPELKGSYLLKIDNERLSYTMYNKTNKIMAKLNYLKIMEGLV